MSKLHEWIATFPRSFAVDQTPSRGLVTVSIRKFQVWTNVTWWLVTGRRKRTSQTVQVRVRYDNPIEELEAACQTAIEHVLEAERDRAVRWAEYRAYQVPTNVLERIDPPFSIWYENSRGSIRIALSGETAFDTLGTAFVERDHYIKWLRRRAEAGEKKNYEETAARELDLYESEWIHSFGDSESRPLTWCNRLGCLSISATRHLITFHEEDELPTVVGSIDAKNPDPFLNRYIKALEKDDPAVWGPLVKN